MDTSRIATKIKILCEKTRLSKECFAVYLGLDQTNIEILEQCKFQLSVDQLEKTCDLFSISLKDLTDESLDDLELDYYFDFSTIARDDLIGIAAINKIARNLKEMNIALTAGKMS